MAESGRGRGGRARGGPLAQDETLSELFGEFPDRLRGDRWQPAIDVFETADAVVVRAELSGVRGEDLRVSVDGNLLRMSGLRRAPSDPDVRRLHQMEIAFGPFERAMRISIPFDRDRVTAHLEDGFLTVTLPRRRAKVVTVETGEA